MAKDLLLSRPSLRSSSRLEDLIETQTCPEAARSRYREDRAGCIRGSLLCSVLVATTAGTSRRDARETAGRLRRHLQVGFGH